MYIRGSQLPASSIHTHTHKAKQPTDQNDSQEKGNDNAHLPLLSKMEMLIGRVLLFVIYITSEIFMQNKCVGVCACVCVSSLFLGSVLLPCLERQNELKVFLFVSLPQPTTPSNGNTRRDQIVFQQRKLFIRFHYQLGNTR